MKKLFSFLVAFGCAVSLNATTFNFDSSASVSQTIDGISVQLGQGNNATNAPAYSSYVGMKIYASNTITIDAEQSFSNVQLVFSMNQGKAYLPMTASTGNLQGGGTPADKDDKKVDVWTGSTNHLVFTFGTSGQRIIYQIVVDGEPIDLNPIVYVDTTSLDSSFLYGEPTAVLVPDMNFLKKEYAFIESNIRVSCSLGTILNNDTVSMPYFNCNAGNTLTFETTQPMKGIAINGYVRKQFSASVDNGNIEYCSPGELEDDWEGYPVVIISNINATSVTIQCDKQLRCYAVRVYFEANPAEELDCGGSSGEGEVFNLTFDSADAVYESEDSADEGKPNYTVFLYNNENPDYPYIALDLYPATQGDLVGTYSKDNESLGDYSWYQYGEDEMDFTWMESDGAVAISKTGEIYTISGYISCDDNNTYNFRFTGTMPFYTDTDYYTEGIEDANAEQRATKILRNGQLLLIYKDKVYTVTGQRQ